MAQKKEVRLLNNLVEIQQNYVDNGARYDQKEAEDTLAWLKHFVDKQPTISKVRSDKAKSQPRNAKGHFKKELL